MKTIPIISRDETLFSKIAGMISTDHPDSPKFIMLHDVKPAIDFLNIEIPELVIIDFSDARLDADSLLDMIMRDSWLLHGGVIALASDYEMMKRLEDIRGANILVALIRDNLDRRLPRIMNIIYENRRILFQREIGSHLFSEISGHFKLGNDPLEAACYSNLICNFLYNSNRISQEKKNGLNLSLGEMLINAIEHGNCGITYEEKTAWLKDNHDIMELIEQKCQDPAIARRRVTFEYTIKLFSSSFFIADEGEGFDWKKTADLTNDQYLLRTHGRGIMMTRAVTRKLTYNPKGNEVRFEIDHQSDVESTIPRLFKELPLLEIKADDIIFRQGERSDFLYYIVMGQYEVIRDDNIVSVLSPDDIFMGEMSFLLENWRSATIRAKTDGRVVKISKKEFVEAIKKNPHYALFLSRLLAQRINRLNLQFGRKIKGDGPKPLSKPLS